MEFTVKLQSVQEVLNFVSLATTRPFPVTVCTARHQVNGKCFLELFCLNLKNPVTVRVDCSEEEFLRFRQDADQYLVKE